MGNYFIIIELSDLLSISLFLLGIKAPKLDTDLGSSNGLIRLEIADLVIILLQSLEHIIFNICLELLDRIKHLPIVDHFHVICLRGIVQLLTIFREILAI